MKKILFFAIVFLVLFPIANVKAANAGDMVNFNVDKNYDVTARSQVTALLVKTVPNLYFYIEKSWWDAQSLSRQNEVLHNLDGLSQEFNDKIYPTLTSFYGFEARPGIDSDNNITILFESVNNNLGGYFRSADEYSKLQAPDSSEREMLYLPIAQIDSAQLKVFLAHEFVHLIEANQKERLKGVQEEVWLSEARSDYASTLLGYDDTYEGSNLQRRVQDFLSQPGDSLTEWQGTKYDYAIESVFMHYLVDHYGVAVLTDSLHSKLTGIPSLNEVLAKNGAQETFSQIFANWTISVVLNNCTNGVKYCFINKNLSSLKINPNLIFLPLVGSSSLSISNAVKDWAGSWQKIIGGSGDLTLEFSGLGGLVFKVPYIIYDKNNTYTVNFLNLDKDGKGQIDIKNFGSRYNSLVIMPSLQSKISGFGGAEIARSYSFVVSITGDIVQENPASVKDLLAQIDALKKQIALLEQGKTPAACTAITGNLVIGMAGSQVTCLQQFLKTQGPDIYPEGLVTGFFGNLTKMAVMRFQEKYKAEVLAPINLLQGTGFVGILTRQKINQLLKFTPTP